MATSSQPNYEQGSVASSSLSPVPDKYTPSSSTLSQSRLTPVSNASDAGSGPQSKPGGSHTGRRLTIHNHLDSIQLQGPAQAKGLEAEEDDSGEDDNFDLDGFDPEQEELERKYREADSASPGYTMEEERKVVKKFDRKLVPFLALLYLLSFLDRSSKNSVGHFLFAFGTAIF